eukprot:gene7517-9811_t
MKLIHFFIPAVVAICLLLTWKFAPHESSLAMESFLVVPVYFLKALLLTVQGTYWTVEALFVTSSNLLSSIGDVPSTIQNKFVPDLTGMSIVITGASSGIGADIAELAASRGASLLLAARRVDRLSTLAATCRKLGATAHILEYDAANPHAGQQLVEAAVKHLRGIDMLILNAGTAGPWSHVENITDLDVLEQLMQINYWGYVRATHAALPHLKQSQGRIVVVSSFYGVIPAPFQAGYSATKHALHGFYNTLRQELVTYGVSITVHCPGGVKTEVQGKFVDPATKRHMQLEMPEQMLASSRGCAASILWAASKRLSQVYYPIYAGVLSSMRMAMPEMIDSLFKWMVDYHLDVENFRFQKEEPILS